MFGILLVGIGGVFGSLARFIISSRLNSKSSKTFPLGTFFVNVLGAVLLGVVTTLKLDSNMYKLFAIGFLGAFTTFSTFMYEGFSIAQSEKLVKSGIYIILSMVCGIGAVFLIRHFSSINL